MKKIALLFPGQGSQYAGMGKELCESNPSAGKILELANETLGFDIRKIMFEGTLEELSRTKVTQPAVYAVSALCCRVFAEKNALDSACDVYYAGHSLGEYSALFASGVFDFETGLKLVKARSEFINDASEKNPGKMTAILGLGLDKIKKICDDVSKQKGVVETANFNCPGQVVISGTAAAVEEAAGLCREQGAVKTVMLSVSGPFHSSLMAPASEKMSEELSKAVFSKPSGKFISNCDAEITGDCGKIRENLVKQINHPVLWENSIRRMLSEGVSIFVEIGPGKVLSGLNRKIDRQAKTYNIEDNKSLEAALAGLAN